MVRSPRTWEIRAKRALDIVGAGTGLVLTAPVMAGAAIAVRWTMGTPVLFRQRRPGLHGKPFVLLKFRTMREPAADESRYTSDGARLTRVGRWLRSTSVDELPSLWNVLRGELSLVGPRPLLMEYLERYTAEQSRRHDVPPGVTGWTAVRGRNALSWEEKLQLDIWYVDHWSLLLDLRILGETVVKVLSKEGVDHAGHATMPEFRGTEPAS